MKYLNENPLENDSLLRYELFRIAVKRFMNVIDDYDVFESTILGKEVLYRS